jgi:hypothetical protein
VSRLAEVVRMEAAALEAGRRLRRMGRLTLPVRTRGDSEGPHSLSG